MLRIQERFHYPNNYFSVLNYEEQMELIAYELIREEEERKQWQL